MRLAQGPRGVLVLLAATTLIVACSGADDVIIISGPVSGGSTSSSGNAGTTSGFPGSSSSTSGFAGTTSSASGMVPPVASDRLDVENLRSVRVGHDVCGKPPGKCFDAQSFTVDFDAFTLTHTTCVELAGGPDAGPSGGSTTDATTSRPLSKDEVAEVQKALTSVRVSSAPHTGFDGPIDTLEVTNRNGTTAAYSPSAGCGQDKLLTVEEGFDVVWSTLRAF